MKPDDWDESEAATILDPAAVKPVGWLDDAPASVPDPNASKPTDWDDEEDGVWEAPSIANPACEVAPGCGVWVHPSVKNPAYKGVWHAKKIDNPDFKGVWAPRNIPNPLAFTDDHLGRLGGAKMASIGVEVWTMSGGILFDNFRVSRDLTIEAEAVAIHAPRLAKQMAAKAADELKKEALKVAGGTLLQKAVFYSKSHQKETVALLVTVSLGVLSLFYYLCCTARSGKGEVAVHSIRTNAAGAEETDDEGGGDSSAAVSKKTAKVKRQSATDQENIKAAVKAAAAAAASSTTTTTTTTTNAKVVDEDEAPELVD